MSKIKFSGLLIGDIAWDFGMEFVVSERFVGYWENNRLNGLEFSDTTLNTVFRKKADFMGKSRKFFLAFPEPRLTRFLPSSSVVYSKEPSCSFCSSSEVTSVNKLIFQEGTVDGVDCCIPSCLPGWVVVSKRFIEFIEEFKLMNFFFMEGFSRDENRNLNRKNYLMQKNDGSFKLFNQCTDEELENFRKNWSQI